MKNLKIAHKIYLLGFLQLMLLLITAAVSYSQMSKIGKELIDIAEEDIPLANKLTTLTEHQLEQAILFERGLLKASLVEQGQSQYRSELDSNISKLQKLQKKVADEITDADQFISNAIPLLHDEKARREFSSLQQDLRSAEGAYQRLVVDINNLLSQARSNGVTSISSEISRIEKAEDQLEKKLIAMQQRIQDFTLKSALKAEADEKAGQQLIGTIAVIALLIGAVLPFVISATIVRPINNLRDRLQEISQGDGNLRQQLTVSSNDETGEVAKAFNHFIEVLRNMIVNTNTQADELGRSSETALQVMQTTLANVERQRDETDQVASLVNQMNTTIEEVAQSTSSASAITARVRDRVALGSDSAAETQGVIENLTQEIQQASQVIQSLVTETNSIGSVLESIQGIAEQTNLLALNAAIEAARAGETGRGFAVVADEVRSLAQRTQSSTEDIQNLVQRLQTEANNAVNSMEKGNKISTECLNHSLETSQIFAEARDAVNEINDFNQQISTAAAQQAEVSKEVSVNLSTIAKIAETTSQGAKATSESNENIAKRLIDLHTNLNKFQV